MDITSDLRSTILACFLLLICQVEVTTSQTACSEASRNTNLSACLSGIQQTAQDVTLFWFGSAARAACSPPYLKYTLNCYNPFNEVKTLSELIFGVPNTDLSTLDRYMDVQFTSEPGSYSGCDYHFTSNETTSFTLDPVANTTHMPWDLRMTPNINFTSSSPRDLFTLAVIDVGYGWTHGIYVNIPAGNFSGADIIDDYHGPWNYRAVANPYAFVLYKQSFRITPASVTLPFMGFNMTSFADELSLNGPVAMNWYLAWYDAYSLNLQAQMGFVNNCGSLVANSYKSHKKRPWLPDNLSLGVYIRLQINSSDITYPCGAEEKTKMGMSFYADPIGNPLVSTASARSGSTLTFKLQMNKLMPNNTVDFAGKMYSLVIVDPDIPAGRSAGNNERPLLHGLYTNIQGDNVNTGDVMHDFLGPGPPDFSPHVYYFILYEQPGMLNLSNTLEYSDPACSGGKLEGICMFNVTKFVSTNNLQLAGITWIRATTDDYITCRSLPVPDDKIPIGSASINRMHMLHLTVFVILLSSYVHFRY